MAISLKPRPRLICFSLLFAHLVLAGQAAPARAATTVSTVATSHSLQGANGSKVVVGPRNVLHAVYVSGGNAYYTRSVDGVAWSAPQVVYTAAGLWTAAVAVARDDTVGVAFLSSGGMYYTYRTPTAGWLAQPINLAQSAVELSMVGNGQSMHLAWCDGSKVYYLSFPAIITSKPAMVEHVNNIPLCGSTRVWKPTVAVIPQPGSPKPLILVAYFYRFIPQMATQCSESVFGVVVAQRGRSKGPWDYGDFMSWDETDVLLWNVHPMNAIPNEGASLASAANPETGDYYLAVSQLLNGVASTALFHRSLWDPTGDWASVKLRDRDALIDVAADGCHEFRIAVGDFTAGPGTTVSYGPTWYRTGTWGGKAAAPTWKEPAEVQVSGSARDPQAIFWRRAVRETNSTRHVHALFDEKSGSAYSVKHDDLTTPGFPRLASPLACLDRSKLNRAQSNLRWEAGLLFTTSDPGAGWTIRTGVGGRFDFNAMRGVALEAEVSHLPERTGGTGRLSGGSATQGLFGVKVGKRFERWGVFGKARPGFVSFSRAVREARFDGPFLVGLRLGRVTHFALDVGGGFEVYPSRRTSLRFDFGDAIIPRGERTNLAPAGGLLRPGQRRTEATALPSLSRHNFQFSTGLGFRF